MAKYVMYKSATEILFPPKNIGSIMNYDKNIELLIEDGYKELIEVEKPVTNRIYHIEYVETDVISETIIYDETQEEADLRDLENAKIVKISENDTARDSALNQGVEYREILFDSDTDQKVNLIATVERMSDEDVVTWFGMDNQGLECTKEDLINIGGLITMLHTFCWTKNAQTKAEIDNATTIEEVNNVVIDYEMEE